MLRLCLGRYLILGWPRLIACSAFLVVVPPISLARVVIVDRTQHVWGRPSAEFPLAVAAVVGLLGVGVIRWLTNGGCVAQTSDLTTATGRASTAHHLDAPSGSLLRS